MARVQDLGISAAPERKRDTSVLGEMRDEWKGTYFGSRDDITSLADLPSRAASVARGAYRDFRYGGVGDGVSRFFTGGNIDDPWTVGRTIHTGLVLAPMLKAGHGITMAKPVLSRIPGASAAMQVAERLSGLANRFTEAVPHAMSRVASPVRFLADKLFGIEAPALGTGERFVFDSAYAYLESDLADRAYRGLSETRSDANRKGAEASAAGAPAGAGTAYVNSQTNAVPAAVSQDARVNREIIRRAYRDYDATTNKAAFAEALAPIMGDKEAVAAVEALNSADYYSKTHKGQPLSRLMNGLEGSGNEFLKAQLQETLDKHNEAFKALSLREQLTGGM